MIDEEEIQRDIQAAEVLAAATGKSLTIELTDEIRIFLAVRAVLEERTVADIALKELRRLALEEISHARQLVRDLDPTTRATGAPKGRSTKLSESTLRDELAAALAFHGFKTRTEVGTGAGIADVVIDGDDGPLAVIEVKLKLEGWRGVHQASGQAQGYAKALRCSRWFVVAGEVEARHMSKKVLTFATSAAFIAEALAPIAADGGGST